MTILLPALAVAFAAFCIWLIVRIVNRKQRWAKWTLVGLLIGLPILYVLTFGPVCWASSRSKNRNHASVEFVEFVYQPLLRLTARGPYLIRHSLAWYSQVGAQQGWIIREGCFSDDCYWDN